MPGSCGRPVVLHVCRPAVGGVRRHLETLLPGLERLGWRCELAGPVELLTHVRPQLGSHTLREVPIGDRPGLLRDLRAASALRRIVRECAPTLVHAHGFRAAWVAGLSRAPVPLVVTLHNLYSAPRSYLARRLAAGALRRADALIAVSKAVTSGVWSAGVRAERVHIIPNGILPPMPLGAQRRAIRERLGAGPGDVLVVCVARLMADKGVDVLVRAWPEVLRAVPAAQCLIAGDGPDMPELQRLSDGHPGIRFLGFHSDVYELYSAADIVAIPSRREGQSIVCLEAMASVPAPAIVAARAGGLPEMLEDGVSGLLVPPDNPDALAQGIIRAALDERLRANLSLEGGRTVRERYSAEGMARATRDVYAGLLARPGERAGS